MLVQVNQHQQLYPGAKEATNLSQSIRRHNLGERDPDMWSTAVIPLPGQRLVLSRALGGNPRSLFFRKLNSSDGRWSLFNFPLSVEYNSKNSWWSKYNSKKTLVCFRQSIHMQSCTKDVGWANVSPSDYLRWFHLITVRRDKQQFSLKGQETSEERNIVDLFLKKTCVSILSWYDADR